MGINLTGPVGGNDFNTQQLQNLPAGPVHVFINSGGGCVTNGLAIYHLLREHAEAVTCLIQFAGSAAVLPALAGDHRTIHADGSIFIHQCWGSVVGRERDMLEAARMFRRQNALYTEIVAERTGLSLRKVKALMLAETRLTANEAVRLGFAHEIAGDTQQQAQPIPAGDLQQTALAALRYETRAGKPHERQLRTEAVPAAMVSHPTAPALFPQMFATLPPGPASVTLDRLYEAEQRMAQIRCALETRLRRAINCGGRVVFPVRSSWICTVCSQEQHTPPIRNRLATPCTTCGAHTPLEE